jgi:methanogenic corrinoid protein MtbC1
MDIMKTIPLPNMKEAIPIKRKIIMGTFSNNPRYSIRDNIIINFLNAEFEVLILGLNVKPSQYVHIMRKFFPQILILFCQSNTDGVRELIQVIKQAGLRSRIRIILFDPNINEIIRDEVHADACANDGQKLLDIVNEILSNPAQKYF